MSRHGLFVFLGLLSVNLFAENYPYSMGQNAVESRENGVTKGQAFPGANLPPDKANRGKTGISGKCVIANPHSINMDIPCPAIQLELQNAKRKTIAKTQVSEGEFYFPVKKDEMYYIVLKSPMYIIADNNNGPFQQGDAVLLKLKK